MEDRILVTGSTGFLGRALLASLKARGCKVTAFLRESSSESYIPQGTCGWQGTCKAKKLANKFCARGSSRFGFSGCCIAHRG